MKREILIAGFGGQGILLMGRLLAEAAMIEDCFATWFPSYGPEMRGGTANCTVVLSDEEIGSPVVGTYDVAVVMNQPSLERFEPTVRAGGLLLVNSTMVPIQAERHDIEIRYVPAGTLASELGEERCANVVMLGALLESLPAPSRRGLESAVEAVIGAKKPAAVDVNRRAIQAGLDAVRAEPVGPAGTGS